MLKNVVKNVLFKYINRIVFHKEINIKIMYTDRETVHLEFVHVWIADTRRISFEYLPHALFKLKWITLKPIINQFYFNIVHAIN